MRGKAHCTIGILTAIYTSVLFRLPINLFLVFLSGVLSLLPDLDEQNSTISNFVFKKNTSQFIFKLLIYIINTFIFFISLKINNNFIVSSFITFIAITIVERNLSYIHLRKLLLSFMFILLGLCLYLIKFNIYIVIFVVMFAFFPWLKHRGFSHSLLAVFVVYFLLSQIESIYNLDNLALICSSSYASHIFLGDLFTKSGVPLLYPFNKRKFSLLNSRVGTFWSNAFEIFMVVFLIFITIFTLINLK